MEIYSSCKWLRFVNQKNEEITKTNLRKTYAAELISIACFFKDLTVKSVLIPLKHTFELKY